MISGAGTFTNAGTITHSGTLYIGYTTLNNLAGAVYNLQGSGLVNNYYSMSGTVNNAGLFIKSGTGTASIVPSFNNTGTVEVDGGILNIGNFTQTAGSTTLNGGSLAFSNPAQILGGQLLGSGTINGSVADIGGLLSPGHSAGSITINGDYTEGTAGAMLVELGGLGSGQFDYVDVNGTASLDGTLEVAFLNGFHPSLGDTFHFLDFNSRNGQFDAIDVLGDSGYRFNTVYTSSGADLVTTATPEPGTLSLLAIGAFCLGIGLWKAKKRPAKAVGTLFCWDIAGIGGPDKNNE
ncbi:MAG: PEP-CTERM sorting domain-containing protein [Thermoguttaceae bacterium]|jgi:hypothetical protein